MPCRKVTPFQNTAFLVCLYLLSHFSYNSFYLTSFCNIFDICSCNCNIFKYLARESKVVWYLLCCQKGGEHKIKQTKACFPRLTSELVLLLFKQTM